MFQFLARLLGPSLYDAIQPYRVTDEALMPDEYRFPDGRWWRDDWFMLKSTTRKECYYRVPLPFRVIDGDFRREWLLFDPSYPLSPGAKTEMREGLMYVLTDRGDYGVVKYAAFINGEWRHVFTKYTGKWFGKRLSWYIGLHQDNHVSLPTATRGIRSDLGCWWEPPTASWVKEV